MWSKVLSSLCLALCVSCCSAQLQAQIKIEPTKQAYWTFPNAQLIDGKVVAPVESRPKLDRVETTIRVEAAVDYKFTQLKARRLPEYEKVTLDETAKGVYRFRAGAPEGLYLIEFTGIDPGISSDEIRITLERDTPIIDVIDDGSLPVISKEARKVMADYVASMAKDMETLSANASEYKTVADASGASNALDQSTRNAFKAAIANVMAPRLGKDDLPANAADVFKQIATGYRSVK